MKHIFEQKSGIYKITNIINNKIYVGSSKNISVRITTHRYQLRHNKHCNNYLQKSWNKYGESNFIFEVIEYCEKEELCKKEEHYQRYYDSSCNKLGYNLETFEKGRKNHSEESKKKIGLGNKGKRKGIKPSEKTIEFITWLGKQPKSEEHKKKMSIAHQGKKRKPFSKEWREKMSNSGSIYWDIYDLNNNIIYKNKKTSILAKELGVSLMTITGSYKKNFVILKKYIIVKTDEIPNYNNYKNSKIWKN